jgi:two-component system, LytTR family, response regulator LytT
MRLLIVEDEPLLRERLLRLCREIVGPAFSAVAVGTLAEAREHLHDRAFDGLILDLNLGGHDGFSLLREAVASALDVVVVSGHGERALEAFELGVLDFVPKPFGAPRLTLALQRLSRAPAAGARSGRAVTHLAVWRARGVALVAVDDIACIRAVPEGSEIHLRAGGTELHAKPLDRLLPLLPAAFVRCHRSWIVHLGAVRALHSARGSRNWLTLHGDIEVPVGRTWLDTLRDRLA